MKISRFWWKYEKKNSKIQENSNFFKFEIIENQANFDENMKITANFKKIQNFKKVKKTSGFWWNTKKSAKFKKIKTLIKVKEKANFDEKFEK